MFEYLKNTLRQEHCVPFPTEHVTVHMDEFIVKAIIAPGCFSCHQLPCLTKGL